MGNSIIYLQIEYKATYKFENIFRFVRKLLE